jgi:hypothetical protein
MPRGPKGEKRPTDVIGAAVMSYMASANCAYPPACRARPQGQGASEPVSKPGRRLRAQDLATKAIEKIIDPAEPPEERAQRRRRLTKGPTEFREDRVDLPRAKRK